MRRTLPCLTALLLSIGCGEDSADGDGSTTSTTGANEDSDSGTAESAGSAGDGDGSSGDGDGSSGDGDGSSGDGDGSGGDGDGDGDGSGGDGDGSGGDGDGDGSGGDGDGDGSGGDGDGSSGDGDGATGDGDGTTGDGDGATGDGDGCVITETPEVSCDGVDNDCNGRVDDVDTGNDGFCDCLSIGILGDTGFHPTANFEAWLQAQGTAVERTLLAGTSDVVTPALLANYDVLLIDRIERALSPTEAAAVESFVKTDGNGMITLIGYNFDGNNPVPERDRANTVLSPFGLEYQGPYVHTSGGVTPTFDQTHEVSMGIVDVNYAGGMVMADVGAQGVSSIFATVPSGDAGLAHETASMGGRVIVWGDEWLTFDSDWVGFADVQSFWAQMVFWVQPKTFCTVPQ